MKTLVALPLLAALSAHAQVAEPVDSIYHIYQKDGWESPDGVPPVAESHKWDYGEKKSAAKSRHKCATLSATKVGDGWCNFFVSYGGQRVSNSNLGNIEYFSAGGSYTVLRSETFPLYL